MDNFITFQARKDYVKKQKYVVLKKSSSASVKDFLAKKLSCMFSYPLPFNKV